jgi:hypothetical protein
MRMMAGCGEKLGGSGKRPFREVVAEFDKYLHELDCSC